MRVTAVPDVRASAICSNAFVGRVERSSHEAALQIVLLEKFVLVMTPVGRPRSRTHPFWLLNRRGRSAALGGCKASKMPCSSPAVNVSTGPPTARQPADFLSRREDEPAPRLMRSG